MRSALPIVISLLLPLTVGAQGDISKIKINDAGFGFGMSSKGQSLFYYRGTSPFKLYQGYFAGGFHIEEKTLPLAYYNYYTQRWESSSSQQFYLQLGVGGRRSLFLDKLATGFFPYVTVQGGTGGYLAELGSFTSRFKKFNLIWAPYLQVGAGAGIHATVAMYRLDAGYLSSIDQLSAGGYPGYKGVYIRFILSSGTKPNRRSR